MDPEVEVEAEDEGTLDQRLTETIREGLSRLNGTEEDKTEKEAPAAEAAPEEPVEEQQPKSAERPRGPDGKFLPKSEAKESAAPAKAENLDTPPSQAAAPAQAAAAPQEPEQPLLGPSGQPIDLNRPPSSWKPAAKAVWANLPPEVRAEVYRREGDFHLGNKPLKENADFGQAIRQVVEPYKAMIEAEGGTVERSIAGYLQAAAALRRGTPEQKVQTLMGIDQQFGGALQQHFQRSVANEVARLTGQAPQQPQQQQVFQDPRVDQLMARLEAEDRAKRAAEQAASNQATEEFISAKDDKGHPKFPFVDNVIDDMSARVAQIRQANPAMAHKEVLTLAYEQAVWANPETRAVLIKQQTAAAAAPAETLRKVGQAKAAAAVNVPKRGSIPATAPAAKWGTPEADEEMLATLRQLSS